MRKLFILTFGLVLSMLLTASPVMAASPSVTINGTPVSFTNDSGYPFLDSANRAQVPLRATMEAFGCIVSWNAQTKTVIVEKDGMKVEVPIGQSYILKNGQQVYNDTVAVIKDNKTYLPIRVVLESFGAKVDWDAANKNVVVSPFNVNSQNVSANATALLNQMKSTFTLVVKEENGNAEGMTFYYYRYNGDLEYDNYMEHWKTLEIKEVEQAMAIWASELYNTDAKRPPVALVIYCNVDGDTGTTIYLAGITYSAGEGAYNFKRYR